MAGEEEDLGVAGEEDNRLTGDGAEEVGLESFGLKSQKLPESSETEKKNYKIGRVFSCANGGVVVVRRRTIYVTGGRFDRTGH